MNVCKKTKSFLFVFDIEKVFVIGIGEKQN